MSIVIRDPSMAARSLHLLAPFGSAKDQKYWGIPGISAKSSWPLRDMRYRPRQYFLFSFSTISTIQGVNDITT